MGRGQVQCAAKGSDSPEPELDIGADSTPRLRKLTDEELGGDRVVMHSAGSDLGESLNPAVVETMSKDEITPVSWSGWAAATHVPPFHGRATSTGSSRTRRNGRSKRCAPFATTSSAASAGSSMGQLPPTSQPRDRNLPGCDDLSG